MLATPAYSLTCQCMTLFVQLCSLYHIKLSIPDVINSFMTEAVITLKPVHPLICRENQWTGFYMIAASVMKELNNNRYVYFY